VIKRVLVACVVAILLAVTACGTDKPKAEPTTTPTTSSSPSPTTPTSAKSPPQRPVLPTTAKKKSAAGAKAFSRYFVDVLWYTAVTGKTSLLNQVSMYACANCRNYNRNITMTYKSGGWIRTSKFLIESVSVNRSRGTRYVLDLKVFYPTQSWKRSAAEPAASKPAAGKPLQLGVEWKGKRWQVGAFDAR